MTQEITHVHQDQEFILITIKSMASRIAGYSKSGEYVL